MQPAIIDKSDNIIYRKWAVSDPRGIFLLVHGLGGHSGRWELFANFFLEKGFSSYALELKGFGHDALLKGHVDSFRIYYRDITNLFEIIRKENPGKRVFIAGESLGALIAFIASAEGKIAFNNLICLSPAFNSKLKFSLSEYIGIFISFIYNPKRQFKVHFNSMMCTLDEECLKVLDADPLEHRLATSKFLICLLIAQIKAKSLISKIKIPTLFLLSGKDSLVSSEYSEKLFNKLNIGDKEIIKYPNMCHALSIGLERKAVFSDILNWVKKRT